MSKKNWLIALLVVWPLASLAENQEQLVERYTALAGSKQNATSLVTGLRDGKEVTLKSGTTTETFTVPTEKMGYGNIDHALALAEASLAKQGITNPTAAQLEAALVGGDVTTSSGKVVPLYGVLQLRADGMGWGRIAQEYGFKLGDLKRSDRAPDRVAQAERGGKPEKPERPNRPEKPERPEKPGRPR